jgi:speckle-type POZ protein
VNFERLAVEMETQEIDNSARSTTELMPAISSASVSYSCETEGMINEIDFKWTIERLAFLGNKGIWETLTSTEFSDHKFKLEIVQLHQSHLMIRLILSNLRCPIEVEIAVCNEKGQKIFEDNNMVDISPNTNKYYARLLYMENKKLKEIDDFVNGKTTIHCKIKSLTRKQLTGKDITATERDLIHKTPNLDLFLRQLEESFEKMLFSDVTFNVRGRKFTAHKNILAMRSPVFAAMFQHPTKELLSGQVEVEDVDPDVFQEVLRYMYTGSPQSTAMDVMAPELLVAADKYLLDQLKFRCETHLIRQMSAKNCLDLLTLTTHHPAEHLKKFAIDYFRRYPSKFTLKSFD